jgi:hypothetical protein
LNKRVSKAGYKIFRDAPLVLGHHIENFLHSISESRNAHSHSPKSLFWVSLAYKCSSNVLNVPNLPRAFWILIKLNKFTKAFFEKNVTCLAKFAQVMSESGVYCASGACLNKGIEHFNGFTKLLYRCRGSS